jgi:hypothetical protein
LAPLLLDQEEMEGVITVYRLVLKGYWSLLGDEHPEIVSIARELTLAPTTQDDREAIEELTS